jgi:hypothetical protein
MKILVQKLVMPPYCWQSYCSIQNQDGRTVLWFRLNKEKFRRGIPILWSRVIYFHHFLTVSLAFTVKIKCSTCCFLDKEQRRHSKSPFLKCTYIVTTAQERRKRRKNYFDQLERKVNRYFVGREKHRGVISVKIIFKL